MIIDIMATEDEKVNITNITEINQDLFLDRNQETKFIDQFRKKGVLIDISQDQDQYPGITRKNKEKIQNTTVHLQNLPIHQTPTEEQKNHQIKIQHSTKIKNHIQKKV